MNNDNFLIEETDLELARDICKDIEAPEIRNRAMANALASDIASKYFAEIDVDTDTGLHKISRVLNDIDIADIYIKDNYIDVRVYFNENELCVPKTHFDNDLLPIAYMFIKLEPELSGGTVTGFITPTSIDLSSSEQNYYKVREEDLVSYYDIEPLLVTKDIEDLPKKFEIQIFDYLDNKLEEGLLATFYKSLLDSAEARILLRNAAKTQSVFNFISLADSSIENITEEPAELDIINNEDTSNELEFFEEENVTIALETEAQEEPLLELDENSAELDYVLEPAEEPLDSAVEFEIENSKEDILELDESQGFLSEVIEQNDLQPVSVQEDNELLDFETDNTEIIKEEPHTITAEETEILESLPLEETPQIISDQELIPEVVTESPVYETIQELDDNFSTNTTPSLDTIEETIAIDELENMLENDSNESILEKQQVEEQIKSAPQIEELFPNESEEILEQDFIQPAKQSGNKILPLLGILTIIAAAGYYGYTKFGNNVEQPNTVERPVSAVVKQENTIPELPKTEEAMPIETIENISTPTVSEEAASVSIPAIEENLDASILVSNLSVTWEVPVGYVSNNVAKRYFTKIGKIIQLNLKTELLLLSKPPITNKIMIELEFNKNNNKFNVKGMTASSGEKVVDDLILRTVRNALDLNLKTNMNSFSNISGNPILVIKL